MLTISEYNLILILLQPSPWNIQAAMCLCCYLATPLEHTSSNVPLLLPSYTIGTYKQQCACLRTMTQMVLHCSICFKPINKLLSFNQVSLYYRASQVKRPFLFSLVQCCISYTFDTGCLHPFPQTLIHVPLSFVVLGFFCKYLFKMI